MFDAAARGRYATDASIYQIDPVGVLVPRDATDVLAALEVAREQQVPVLARGAGTSQCGQTVGEALVIDHTRHLNGIGAFDPDARTIEVEPGVVLDRLNAWLRPHGLWFPVDVSTSAQATIGGMAGNNSCGSRSITYGNMVHNVLGIDALLADGTRQHFGPFGTDSDLRLGTGRVGRLVARLFEIAAREREEIITHWPSVMRRVGGYNLDVFEPRSVRPYTADGSVNLAHLLVGSEGTLALFERLRLQLAPLPEQRVLGVVNFASFHRAMDSAQHIVALGPSAVELVDRTMIELARENPAFRPVIDSALVRPDAAVPEALLLVEFAGHERAPLEHRLRDLEALLADQGLPDCLVAMPEPAPQKALWEVRKAGLNIMMSLRGDGKPVSFIEDCAVPLEHLADYTAALTEVFARHGTRGTWYAHASVGTLHVRPILDMRRSGPDGGAARMRAIADEASALVRRFKGAYSGEHGDGLVRSEWVSWQFGARLTRAFEEVKDLFDPDGILNPGKIVRPPRMDDARLFRYPPGYAVAPLTPALDWSAWNVQNDPRTERLSEPGSGGDPALGLAKAVEMCNNNGHCRKFDADVMCPSFRVTGDERDLTRGRANTLRLALSGQVPGGLGGDAVAQALELCVGCKGCKRECPTGIDMARMKIEAAHARGDWRRPRLRERLIAGLPRRTDRLGLLRALIALRAHVPGAAWLGEKLVGIARERSLPAMGPRFFRREDARTEPAVIAETSSVDRDRPARNAREVVLWTDTFNDLSDAGSLRTARRVLEALGFSVTQVASADEPQRPLCCGRTHLAIGDVDAARGEARRSLLALAPWIARGVPIVGLEPSCLLSLRDEWLAMGLGEDARRLATLAHLFEEFLEAEIVAGRLAPAWRSLNLRVLVHGHCHQKAFGADRPALALLRRIPGLTVEAIAGSCCGMAGPFGLRAETAALSREMGELTLLPAVRAAGDARIVADGTSCRHQIRDGAGREAEHVVHLLADALGVSDAAPERVEN
ncbi:MAG: FAD-linked oxidase C-terminal domain-containing protein [Burkholderiaceae bacterium]